MVLSISLLLGLALSSCMANSKIIRHHQQVNKGTVLGFYASKLAFPQPENITGLLTEEVGNKKDKLQAVQFPRTEKLLCPPDNWSRVVFCRTCQRQAAQVVCFCWWEESRHISSFFVAKNPWNIYISELWTESEISPILFACFPALISGCFLDLCG